MVLDPDAYRVIPRGRPRDPEPLVTSTCMTCRKQVWVASEGTDPFGKIMKFDRGDDQHRILMVHGCSYDDPDEQDYEPDAPEGYHDEPEPRPFVKDGLLFD